MPEREYPADGLTVRWDSDACIHSAACVQALPTVFRPGERPWVHADGADRAALVATIENCPSKALTYSVEGLTTMSETPEPGTVEITVTANGWYQVQGPVRIVASDGSLIREGEKFFLCRCGQSKVKPFCDSSHKTCGFTDDGLGKKSG